MQYVFPDYYNQFKCIKDKCRNNCCIGWEIDIDDDTYEFYKKLDGEMGDKLSKNISTDGTPHFVLDQNERCPFLNQNNLCELIINLGENSLCQICSDHPRFRNFLPEREEVGIGLCCEAAASLILGKCDTVSLYVKGECAYEDDIIILRDRVISLLQDRRKYIFNRFDDVFELFGVSDFHINLNQWIDFFISLERLDEKWTELLILLRDDSCSDNDEGFSEYIRSREYEYEQLAVYIIYRHMINSSDADEALCWVIFALISIMLIYNLGKALYTKNGSFSFDDQVQLCRMFSSEIEYSDENVERIIYRIKGECFNE